MSNFLGDHLGRNLGGLDDFELYKVKSWIGKHPGRVIGGLDAVELFELNFSYCEKESKIKNCTVMIYSPVWKSQVVVATLLE